MKVASSSKGMDFDQWKPFFLDPRLPGGEGKDKMEHYRRKPSRSSRADAAPHGADVCGRGHRRASMGVAWATRSTASVIEHALRTGGPEKDQSSRRSSTATSSKADRSGRARCCRGGGIRRLESAESILQSDDLERGGAGRGWRAACPTSASTAAGAAEVSGGRLPEAFLQIFVLGLLDALGFARGRMPPTASGRSRVQREGGHRRRRQGAERVQVRLHRAEIARRTTCSTRAACRPGQPRRGLGAGRLEAELVDLNIEPSPHTPSLGVR